MKVDLFELCPYVVFNVLISNLALHHESTGEKSQHLIIVTTYTTHLDLFLWELECPLTFICPFLEPEKSKMLTTHHESLSPITQTVPCLLYPLYDHTLIVDYQCGAISQHCNMWRRA